MAKSDRASYVCVYWISENNSHIDVCGSCCPGQVQYFFKHNLVLEYSSNKVTVPFLLTCVEWYKHPENNYLLSPVTLWLPDYVPFSPASFIPISRIAGRCMQVKTDMSFSERPNNNGSTIIINPIGCANLIF